MNDSLFERFAALTERDGREDWLDVERRARRRSRRRGRGAALAAAAAVLALLAAAPAVGIGLGPFDEVNERLTTIVDGLTAGSEGDTGPQEMAITYDAETRVAEIRGTIEDEGVVAVRLSFRDGVPPLVADGRSYDFSFGAERLQEPAYLEGLDASGARVTATEIPAIPTAEDEINFWFGGRGGVHVRNLEDVGPGPFKFMEPFVPNANYCLSHSSEKNWNELRRC